MATLVRRAVLGLGGSYAAAIGYSLVEHDPLESHIVSTIVTTAMWMPGGPLHTLYAPLSKVPSRASDVTASRVEHCLKQSGRLPLDCTIESIDVQPFGLQGDGHSKGMLSEICRVTCTFSEVPAPSTSTVPETFIVKLSPSDFGGRLYGRLCLFQNEVNFYKHNVGPKGGLRVPDCLFANYDPLSGEATLFLEDLSPLVPVDQNVGWTIDEAKSVLSTAARFHAHYWDADYASSDEGLSSLLSGTHRPTLERLEALYLKNVDKFAPAVEKHLDLSVSKTTNSFLVDVVKPNVKAVTDSAFFMCDRPFTLTHGDLRCENVFFTPPGEDDYVIDFQIATFAAAAMDANYIAIYNSGQHVWSEETELSLMEHYYAELLKAKPGLAYTFTEFCHDYVAGLFCNAYKFALSAADGAEGWSKNPDVTRQLFRNLDFLIQRWNLEDFFLQGCNRIHYDETTNTCLMSPLTDTERFMVLPQFAQERISRRDGGNPTPDSALSPSIMQTWSTWLWGY